MQIRYAPKSKFDPHCLVHSLDKTRGVAECFTRFSSTYSPNTSQVHYHTINAQDELFYFFYNIRTLLHSKQYFKQIDNKILLTC